MKKRLLTILMILMLLLSLMPAQAFAEKPEAEDGLKYLNIGDSIAAGLSALPYEEDYFAQYAGYLGEETLYRAYNGPGMDPNLPMPWIDGAVNLGFPGLDSMELLTVLTYDSGMQYFVSEADVITISIGGNNLLTPVIASVFQMYGLVPGINDEADLMDAIMSYGEYSKDVWNANLQVFTMSALSSDPYTLGWFLETRTAQFLKDWPTILDQIELLNPDAHIIAMTLYNPIEKEDNEALYNRYEALVGPMNMAIKNSGDGILVAEVAEKFLKKPDAVAFRLSWLEEMPPVLVDPHPTTLGHKLIFKEIKKLGNPSSF